MLLKVLPSIRMSLLLKPIVLTSIFWVKTLLVTAMCLVLAPLMAAPPIVRLDSLTNCVPPVMVGTTTAPTPVVERIVT